MSYSDLIHEYLDGCLETTDEETLFNSLAKDPELRNEFNQQMKIHLIASADMNAIAPPAAVTANIFSSLGFSTPGGTDALDNKKIVPIPHVSFWKKYAGFLLIAMLAATLTTGVYITYDQIRNSANSHNAPKGIPVVTSVEGDASGNKSTTDYNIASGSAGQLFADHGRNTGEAAYASGNNNDEVARLKGIIKSMSRNIVKSRGADELASAGDTDQTNDLTLNRHNNSSLANQLLINPVLVVEGNMPLALRSPAANIPHPVRIGSVQKGFGCTKMELIDAIDNTRYIVQVKGIMPQTANPNISLASRDKNALNNLGFSVFYKLTGSSALGAEFGWESFPQQFSHNIEGITHTQKQAPILFWYGGSYRYTAANLILNGLINPFATATIGGTTAGPILKSQIGLEINPFSNIGFIISGDFTNLFYNVDGKIYNTSKTGVAYGISFKF